MVKIVEHSYRIIDDIDGIDILKKIERVGRTCYKSEDSITDDSCIKFVKMLIERGHEAMIEHVHLSVNLITDRGITHELVRHRLANYAQESTRYCNYGKEKFGKEITVVKPIDLSDEKERIATLSLVAYNQQYMAWLNAMIECEDAYFKMLDAGCSPQVARSVLPTCLKTEINVTANLREWRHIFKLRTAKAAHPDIRALLIPLLIEFQTKIPVIFDDIVPYET